MKYTLAEFFCGCGGFSRGFTRSGRFNAVLGNDIKKEALRTYEFNHRDDDVPPAVIRDDIRRVPLVQIRNTLAERGVRHGDLDCLIGGPPCQGFSQLRRTEEREGGKIVKFRGYSKLSDDPRNDLVLRYLEIAEYLKPKFVLIENVPQMLNHGFQGRLGRLSETVVEILEEMGYSVDVSVVTAANYGVPQLRDRAIFIASAIGSASFPKTTHADPSSSDLKGRKPWRTVADALRDLPDPHEQDVLGGRSTSLYRSTSSEFATMMQSKTAFPFNHISRTYRDSVLNIIREMHPGETWDAASERMQAHYEQLIAQEASARGITRKAAAKALKAKNVINEVFYKRYYWSAYTRLAWEAPALTITANANFLGSGRFSHPVEMRGITMREAARLQSFDDDFRFITSETDENETTRVGVGMDMIGEAVPPLLAAAFAKHIARELDTQRGASPKRSSA